MIVWIARFSADPEYQNLGRILGVYSSTETAKEKIEHRNRGMYDSLVWEDRPDIQLLGATENLTIVCGVASIEQADQEVYKMYIFLVPWNVE